MQVKMNTLNELKQGVDVLANAVAVTMGPKGRNVVIKKPGLDLKVTKDGVTVAEAIDELDDKLLEIGANMVKEVASRAGRLSGDGTTTATVLAQAMIDAGVKSMMANVNPIDLKRGMDKAVELIVEKIKGNSSPINLGSDELFQVASISANNDETLGALLVEAFEAVGKDGVVSVEPSPNHLTYVDTVSGMQFDRGYNSPLFTTDPKGTICELINPMYLINDGKITNMTDIIPVMELAKRVGRPLVVIAEDIDGQAQSQLLVNTMHQTIKSVAIKAPGFSESRLELLTDMAIITRSVVFGESSGFTLDKLNDDNINEEMFGGSEAISVERSSTIIVDGIGEKNVIDARVEAIEELLSEAGSDHEKKQLESRIAKLSGGVGVLYIGANTPVEAKEKQDRADDALCAIQAALQEGVVLGGGVELFNARECLWQTSWTGDEEIGARIIYDACAKPLKIIADNSGANPEVIAEGVRSRPVGSGYNAKTGEYCLMQDDGIIDPTKVTRVALESANSAAGMVLLTSCAIY